MKKDRPVFRRFNGFFLLTLVLATGWLLNSNPALGQMATPLHDPNSLTQFTPAHWVYVPVIFKDKGPCQQTVCNGDFENGPDGVWVITSSNSLEDFVIVNMSDYGIFNHSGNYSAWLGGDPAEITTITQQITLPADAAQLDYWYWINSGDSCGQSKVTVTLDTIVLKTYDLCQVTSSWTNEKIAIPADFQGKTVNLIFKAETANFSNFFLDDVSILGTLSPVLMIDPGQTSNAGRPFSPVLRKSPGPSAEKGR